MKYSLKPTLTMELHKNWLIKVKAIGECDDRIILKQTCVRPENETAIPIQSTLLMLSSSWLTSGKLLILSLSVTNDTPRRISKAKIPGPGPKELKKCEENGAKFVDDFCYNLRVDVFACQKRQSRVRFWALVVI